MTATGEMSTLDRTGDTKIIWDRDNPHEVEAARKTFHDLVDGKRFAAFKADKKGDKGEQIRSFNPDAERIILVPPMVGG